MADYLKDDSLNEEDKTNIKRILDFILRPEDLDESDTWPCVHIKDYESYIVHPSDKSSKLPEYFSSFLELDIRNLPTPLDRVDHVSCFLSDKTIIASNEKWKLFLIKYLHAFCEMKRPRDRTQWDGRIMACLDGTEIFDREEELKRKKERAESKKIEEQEEIRLQNDQKATQKVETQTQVKLHDEQHQNTILHTVNSDGTHEFKTPRYPPAYPDPPATVPTHNAPDLAKSIQIFSNLFPQEQRPTGSE